MQLRRTGSSCQPEKHPHVLSAPSTFPKFERVLDLQSLLTLPTSLFPLSSSPPLPTLLPDFLTKAPYFRREICSSSILTSSLINDRSSMTQHPSPPLSLSHCLAVLHLINAAMDRKRLVDALDKLDPDAKCIERDGGSGGGSSDVRIKEDGDGGHSDFSFMPTVPPARAAASHFASVASKPEGDHDKHGCEPLGHVRLLLLSKPFLLHRPSTSKQRHLTVP